MFIDRIVNNIRLKQNLTCVKKKKNAIQRLYFQILH